MHRGIGFTSLASRALAEERMTGLASQAVVGLMPPLQNPNPPPPEPLEASLPQCSLRVLLRLGGLRRRKEDASATKWNILRKHLNHKLATSVLQSLSHDAAQRKHFLQDAEMNRQEALEDGETLAADEEDMYSLENLDKRFSLRHDPTIQNVLEEWWRCAQRFLQSEGKRDDRVEEGSYLSIFLKIYKVMISEYNRAEAAEAVAEDWQNDSADSRKSAPNEPPHLTSEAFMDALFELADVWTVGTDPADYTAFLTDLLSRVSCCDIGSSGPRSFLLTKEIVAGSGQPEDLKEEIAEERRRAIGLGLERAHSIENLTHHLKHGKRVELDANGNPIRRDSNGAALGTSLDEFKREPTWRDAVADTWWHPETD